MEKVKRMALKLNKVGIISSLTVLVLSSGCAGLWLAGGAAAGAGTYAYVMGELRAADDVSLDTAHDAAIEALKALDFAIMYKEKDALQAAIEGSSLADTNVKIRLKKKAEKLTEIRIRVDLLGNELLSRHILQKMRTYY